MGSGLLIYSTVNTWENSIKFHSVSKLIMFSCVSTSAYPKLASVELGLSGF